MLNALVLSAACPLVFRALVVTRFVAPPDSGDPVPFPAVEGRLSDWWGLGIYSVLVLAVCLVAWRMARARSSPTPADGAGEGAPPDAQAP
jgi:hypothetical protein